MISIYNLAKQYGSKKVLKGITFSLQKGKVYGLVGANGAGKTTLFKCIAGLENFDGELKSELPDLKNQLGFLQTDPYFFPRITGREYLQLFCNARQVPLEDVDAKNIFDLPLDQYAITYSTGMKKKLAILAILLQQNDFFILDEPFNGVDIQSNIIITELIHRLKQQGKTILISSHIFATLKDTCDMIYVLEKGMISKEVEPNEYNALEQEMNQVTIGEQLDILVGKDK